MVIRYTVLTEDELKWLSGFVFRVAESGTRPDELSGLAYEGVERYTGISRDVIGKLIEEVLNGNISSEEDIGEYLIQSGIIDKYGDDWE